MRWGCAASAELLFKKLLEKFYGHLGTVCTKAPYRSWHIQDRVPMETTHKIWYPASALSNQTWSIHHPSCHSWGSLEHLCCWWVLTCPKGITWGLWIPHTFPAWLPVPAQSIATHSQLLLLLFFLAAGTELVSELRKGSLQLLLAISYFIGI